LAWWFVLCASPGWRLGLCSTGPPGLGGGGTWVGRFSRYASPGWRLGLRSTGPPGLGWWWYVSIVFLRCESRVGCQRGNDRLLTGPSRPDTTYQSCRDRPLQRVRDRVLTRPEAAAAVTQAIEQFPMHQERMSYPQHRAQGMLIGSGPVEAACQGMVGGRWKGPGIRWSEPGTDAVPAVRALAVEGRHDELIRFARVALPSYLHSGVAPRLELTSFCEHRA